MSPEVLMRKNHSFGTDYYAVGVIAFELLIGKRPYLGKERKEIREQMLSREVKIPPNQKNISKEGIDFINKVPLSVKKDDSTRCPQAPRLQRNSGDSVSPLADDEKGRTKRVHITKTGQPHHSAGSQLVLRSEWPDRAGWGVEAEHFAVKKAWNSGVVCVVWLRSGWAQTEEDWREVAANDAWKCEH